MTGNIIFVTGGVVSSIGKGTLAATIGMLLKNRGLSVKIRKFDPYLNVDPGTMNPIQHGEVFVTEDGTETDLDIGCYERYIGVNAEKGDSITTGKIYSELLQKERYGEYLGATVQVIPHVTSLIKNYMTAKLDSYDFIICEIGGTVGDIEALPFFEAVRQLCYESPRNKIACIHLTLLPQLFSSNEIKTKPTQHSIRTLNSIGIQPNFIVCRIAKNIPHDGIAEKIASCSSIYANQICIVPELDTIYRMPLFIKEIGFDQKVLAHFDYPNNEIKHLDFWHNYCNKILDNFEKTIDIAIVGKYTQLHDAYKSIIEAITHSRIKLGCKVKLHFIDTRDCDTSDMIADKLKNINAIIIPGGFGNDGISGKIAAITYAREKNIPILGICLGMQLMVIEFAKNVAGISDPGSIEFGNFNDNIVTFMNEWQDSSNNKNIVDESKGLGGSMRLGTYECQLQPDSKIFKIYNGKETIRERHRHRYEINANYIDILEKNGLIFSGRKNNICEILEIKNHKWFIGTQYHPEFKSRPFDTHP
ncbi:MAG: CTP synthase, partial [Anaplasmataceae bacterium]|nr:CTP synthase [Anaplasmataceae bacterium]